MGQIRDTANAVYRDFDTDGVASSGAHEPVKSEIRSLFGVIEIANSIAQVGLAIAPDLAARDALFVENPEQLVYVNNNNDAADDAANGVYEYVSGAPRIAIGFYEGVAAVVQPLVDQANDEAILSGNFANYPVDEQVPGQDDPAARSAVVLAQKASGFADDAATDREAVATALAAFAHDFPFEIIIAPTSVLIDGRKPLFFLAVRNEEGVKKSFLAFMPDGTLVSLPLRNFIKKELADFGFKKIQTKDWTYVVAKQAANGRYHRVSGAKIDGTSYPSPPVSYPVTPLKPLVEGDRPVFSTTGANAALNYGQSPAIGVSAQDALTTIAFGNAFTFGSGVASGQPGNTWGAVNTSPGTTTLIPLVEANTSPAADGSTIGETTCSGAANELTRVWIEEFGGDADTCLQIVSNAAHGAFTIASLSKGGGGAGSWYNQLLSHITQGVARMAALGKTYVLHDIVWMQGEGDAAAGTSTAAYKAALYQLLIDIQADYQSITGNTNAVHFLIYQTTNNSATTTGALANLNKIQIAQFEAARENPRIHLIGPLYQLPIAFDGLHPNNIAQKRYSKTVGRARAQLILYKSKPACIDPISVTSTVIDGVTYVTFTFDVPQRPLVLDVKTLAHTKDYGFQVKDDTGILTITAEPVVVEGNKIKFPVDRALDDNAEGRFGLDYMAGGLGFRMGASGNLRDSTARTFSVAGETYSEAHWCQAYKLPINSLENA